MLCTRVCVTRYRAMTSRQQTEFLRALQNPALYDHPVSGFELIETHISWVLLTGHYAYKIKKPLLAPMLYLEVVAFTGTPRHPVIGGKGTPFEYAVKMKQFPSDALLDQVLERNELRPSHIDQLARDVADFHARIAVADANAPFGEPDVVRGHAMDNFITLRQLIAEEKKRELIESLAQWSEERFRRLMEALAERKADGHIRECHGDMHLGNMVLLDGRVVVFDCIEFNPSLNWIDVISELAFLVMDLEQRGRSDFAFRFLNGELERSGDYPGIRLLTYYLVYRAMVRAKVAAIRLSQTPVPRNSESRSGNCSDICCSRNTTPVRRNPVCSSPTASPAPARPISPSRCWNGCVRICTHSRNR